MDIFTSVRWRLCQFVIVVCRHQSGSNKRPIYVWYVLQFVPDEYFAEIPIRTHPDKLQNKVIQFLINSCKRVCGKSGFDRQWITLPITYHILQVIYHQRKVWLPIIICSMTNQYWLSLPLFSWNEWINLPRNSFRLYFVCLVPFLKTVTTSLYGFCGFSISVG